MSYLYDLIVFLLQVALVWFAYLLLPCSEQKGQPKYKYDPVTNKRVEAERTAGCLFNCERGGALQCMMLWDIFSFGVAAAVYVTTIIYMKPFEGMTQSEMFTSGNAYLFFAYIIYGLMSFPFLIFALGPASDLLTKSRPTAYDRYGNTVPFKPDIEIKYENEKLLKESLALDIEDMFAAKI